MCQNIFFLKRSWSRCLISHTFDWRLHRCQAELKKPSCYSARWSQYDIFWTRRTEKWDWCVYRRQLLIPSNPQTPPSPLSETPVIKGFSREGELAKIVHSAPAAVVIMRLNKDARQRQSRDHRPVGAATGGWHCVFLITAKISLGVLSHLLNAVAGGWLPQGSAHRTVSPKQMATRDHSHNRDIKTSWQYSRAKAAS